MAPGTQALGLSKPKAMSIKAKTIFGLTWEKGVLHHSDMDIAWVCATKNIYAAPLDAVPARRAICQPHGL